MSDSHVGTCFSQREQNADLGMCGAHGLFLDGDAALVHGLRLRVAPHRLQQHRQIVQAGCYLRVLPAQGRLPYL